MSAVSIVKFKVEGGKTTLELAIKPGTVVPWREGKITDLDDVLAAGIEIWTDFKKGSRASDDMLKAGFGTDDRTAVVKAMLEKGDFKLTAEEMKAKTAATRAAVVNYIVKYYAHPKTKLPHPAQRIDNALTEMKILIDGEGGVERQATDAVKKIVEVVPLKKMTIEATLKVPSKHMGAAAGIIHKWATVGRENYTKDGCEMEVSVVPGDWDALTADLSKVTKGEFTLDVPGQAAALAEEAAAATKGGKGGRGGKGGKGGKGKGKK